MSFTNNKLKLEISQTSLLMATFITFVFLINYTGYAVVGYGLGIPFNNTTWIGFALILFVGLSAIAILGRIRLSIFHAGYAGCVVLLLVPLLYSDITFLKYEIMTILAILGALALVFIVSQYSSTKFTRSVLCILYMSALIQSVWGLIQYYFIVEPNIFFLAAELAQPVGTFNQINVFSTYINLGSLLSLYFFFTAKKQTKFLLVLTIVVLIINAHLNVLGNIETGRVVSLIAISLYLIYLGYHHKKKWLPIFLILLCCVTSFMPKHWFDIRSSGGNAPVAIQSLGVRPIVYQFGVELALKQPITGYGLGRTRIEFARYYGSQKHRIPESSFQEHVSHIHNEPLQWLIQLGLLSFIAFFTIFGIWIWGLKTKLLNPHILLLGLPFVGHSMLEYPFYASTPHLLVFSIILGLSIKKTTKTVKIPNIFSAIILPINGLICFQIVSFMLTTLTSIDVLTQYQLSDKKDIKILETVSPTPILSLYFEIEKFEWRLDNGFNTGQINSDDIYNFIEWAEEVKEYFPVNKVYVRLAQSYIIANDFQSADKVMNEALLIFPNDEQVTDMVAKMKVIIN